MDGFVIQYSEFNGNPGDYIACQVLATDNDSGGRGHVTQYQVASYQIPSSAPTANMPTYNNPTKVFLVAPQTSEYVQIPSSNAGNVVLVATGANVVVTPIQIIN